MTRQASFQAGAGLPTLPPRPGTNTPAHAPEQLKMFMSAGEIKQQYQPLDADRSDFYDEREGETTSRTQTTWGKPNAKLTTYDKNEGFAKYRENTSDTHYRQYGHSETDEQMWGRKLNESQMSYSDYADVHSGGLGEQATPGYDTLAGRETAPRLGTKESHAGTATWDEHQYHQARYVERKQDEHREKKDWGSLHTTLVDAMAPGGEGFTGFVHLGSQFGESGKPQVVGAHHRIAAMDDIDSNRLLPVLHHKNIFQAKQGFAGIPYT